MRPAPEGEVSKWWVLLCDLPVPPLLENLLQGSSGQEERQGGGRLARWGSDELGGGLSPPRQRL